MVLVGDKKYACETCIKGHRSSSCKHTDRPLFEIKKKGRPVTQCEHCRELRKTRQIHVKCVCESKDIGEGASGSGAGTLAQGGTMVPARAAFPSGLPEGLLEASVAARSLSEGSDSDQAVHTCACKDDATCTCWTPRTSAKRAARATARRGSEARSSLPTPAEVISQPAALVIHAHSGNNRPVLPKPPAERPTSPSRNAHISPPVAPLRGRSPSHGQSFYSPYGRAYEYAHGSEISYSQQPQASMPYPPAMGHSPHDRDSPSSTSPGGTPSFGGWQDSEAYRMFPAVPNQPPLCNCGSSCACPGCLEHNGPNADPAASCVNPETCTACLECNIAALTALSSEVTSALYDPAQAQDVDQWLRQMSSMPDFPSTPGGSNPAFSAIHPTQSDMRYDPSAMNAYRSWNDPRTIPAIPPLPAAMGSECCGGRCKCPAGMCGCPADCCGCCDGCSCVGCDHDTSSARTLTFATSGERAPCCGGGSHEERSSDYPSSGQQARMTVGLSFDGSSSDSGRFADGSWGSQLLTVPRETLSRASSHSSSKSSPNPSTSSSSPVPYNDTADPTHVTSSGHTSGVQSCCTSMNALSTRRPSGGVAGSPPRAPFGSNPSDFDPNNSTGFRSQPSGSRRYS